MVTLMCGICICAHVDISSNSALPGLGSMYMASVDVLEFVSAVV